MLLTAQQRVPELAAIALILVLGAAAWTGVRYLDQAQWVQHTLTVQGKLTHIWSLLQDAEIGQRSYVLTGDERFLDVYHGVDRSIEADIEELAKLVSDNPSQSIAVLQAKPLIAERLVIAEQTIAKRRGGDFNGSLQLVLEGRGLALMNDLRQRFETMQRIEAGLLDDRVASEKRSSLVLAAVLVLAIAGIVASLLGWIASQRRSSRELNATNETLRQTIVEKEAAEQQMRHMQKMEAIGQLTGGIAHDFNNMLAIIMGGINLARRRLASGQAGADQFLGNALEGAQRATALVKRLLAFSRQQPLAPITLDANKFVANISELIQRALGQSVTMETILGGGLWLTKVDPAQLENAILNLCVNARDAMPENGKLTVETANCHLDDRYSLLHPGVPPGQYVLIAVSDTGTGMAPEVVAKAFDPFFTTKDATKGTGLGLSQVFGFVKQSGGHIKIYSEVGEGSTVKLYLPRQYGTRPDDVRVEPEALPVLGTEVILLTEDEASVLELTEASLRELGYTVLRASHAREAIARAQNGEHFDLLLTDIVMPDMNGKKLADAITTLRPGLRVLYMTGFTKNAVVHNGVLDPGVNFLAKPFTIEELSRKVREVLDTSVSI